MLPFPAPYPTKKELKKMLHSLHLPMFFLMRMYNLGSTFSLKLMGPNSNLICQSHIPSEAMLGTLASTLTHLSIILYAQACDLFSRTFCLWNPMMWFSQHRD